MIVGVLAASRSSRGDAANAVIAGGQAAGIQGQLNFSRDMEREADRIGYGLMSGAGFAGSGMAAMFEKLDQASRLNDSGSYPLPARSSVDDRAHRRCARAARQRQRTCRFRAAPVEPHQPCHGAVTGAGADGHPRAGAAAMAIIRLRGRCCAEARPEQGTRGARSRCLERAGIHAAAGLGARRCRTCQRRLAVAHDAVERAFSRRRGARDARGAVATRAGRRSRRVGDAGRQRPALREPTGRAALLLATQVAMALPAGHEEVLRSTFRQAADLGGRASADDATAWLALAQVWNRLGQPLRSIRAEAEARYVDRRPDRCGRPAPCRPGPGAQRPRQPTSSRLR